MNFRAWISRRLPWVLLALTILLSILAAIIGIPAELLLLYMGFIMFSPVGTVIALRRPDNSIGWLYGAIGLSNAIGAACFALIAATLKAGSTDALLLGWLFLGAFPTAIVVWVGMFVSLMLFPSGRFLSRRWALVGWALVVVFMCGSALTIISSPHLGDIPLENPFRVGWLAGPANAASGLFAALGFLLLGLGLISVVLRFVRSTGDERLQFKWFAFSVSLLGVVAPMYFFRGLIWPDGDSLPLLVITAIEFMLIAAVPVSVAVAILKYRLYDIDVIIRRTLVYSILTALLALTYWGGVALLQAALRPITGEGNDLAIVATTLLVAGIFFPLRRRIQNFIDRRFYRRKYDAARTLAAFASAARDEVELEALTGKLVGAVDDTMRPAHVSLWLKNIAPSQARNMSEETK